MRLALLLAAAAHAVGAPAAELDSTALLEPHHKTAHHTRGGHAGGGLAHTSGAKEPTYIMFYHKSGCIASGLICQLLGQQPSPLACSSSKKDAGQRTPSGCVESPSNVEYSLLAADDLHHPWSPGSKGGCGWNATMNMAHLIRDPVDMIISAYLYHTEKPPPPSETPTNLNKHPCDSQGHNRSEVQFADILGLGRKTLPRVREECEESWAKLKGKDELFIDVLHKHSWQEGLKLMAAYLLIGAYNDIPRMVANAKTLNGQRPPGSHIKVPRVVVVVVVLVLVVLVVVVVPPPPPRFSSSASASSS